MTRDVVRTDRAQLATFALSLVGYHELLDLGMRPRYLLGHSLGELSALVASGLLSVSTKAPDSSRCAEPPWRARPRYARARWSRSWAGTTTRATPSDALDDVWIANINGTGQIVVSGTREGLDDLLARHRELGWRRATPLPVGGAFHSPSWRRPRDEFDEASERARWGAPTRLLIANVDGAVTCRPRSGANSCDDN